MSRARRLTWRLAATLVAAGLVAPAVAAEACVADRQPPGARAAEPAPEIELPASLEPRHQELAAAVAAALERVRAFARAQGWGGLAEPSFFDRVWVFDRKAEFDRALLSLAGMDPATELPATYSGALERRVLVAVSPELYAAAYPEGVEASSYEKLLAHEIAHRLHVRILGGDEEAMGPIWFYEGFAIFAADQLNQAPGELSTEELWRVVEDPERGSYARYGQVFRHFAARVPLAVLVDRAGEPGFEAWLRELK